MRNPLEILESHPLGERAVRDPLFRSLATTSASAGWDLLYALLNVVFAAIYQSFWFVSMAAYYALLGAMGLYVLANARKRGSGNAGRVARRCGFGMFLLAVVISGVVCMCIAETRNSSYHMIVMIALATYAFYSATMSIIGAVRARKGDETQRVLRKLSLASTIGSMLMLEFSMLGTFGDPSSASSLIMEAATGAGAVILLLLLGRSLIVQSRASIRGDFRS